MSKKKAILLLSAGIKQNEAGEWESSDLFESEDYTGAPGGKLRVQVAAYLFAGGDYDFIIVPGGQGYDENIKGVDHPSLFTITKKELIKSGVSEKNIKGEEDSNTTYEQLKESEKIIADLDIKQVDIISNDYHLPRVRVMVENILNLDQQISIEYISAEEICQKNNYGKYHDEIKRAYKSANIKRIIENEKKGVEQIKKGTYQY